MGSFGLLKEMVVAAYCYNLGFAGSLNSFYTKFNSRSIYLHAFLRKKNEGRFINRNCNFIFKWVPSSLIK